MRARAAYISSFGTTSILLAGALLMLAMASALVAFRGWPESASGVNVPSVPLAPPSRPAGQVTAVRHSRPHVATAARARAIGRAAAATARSRSASGLVKVIDGHGPSTVGAAPAAQAAPQPHSAPAPQAPAPVSDPTPAPVDPLIPPPPDVTGIVGGTVPPLPSPGIALPGDVTLPGLGIDVAG